MGDTTYKKFFRLGIVIEDVPCPDEENVHKIKQ